MEDKKLEYYKMHQNIPRTQMYVKFVDKVLFTIVKGHRKKHCQNDAVKNTRYIDDAVDVVQVARIVLSGEVVCINLTAINS